MPSSLPAKFMKWFSECIYKKFGANSGNMLLATSIIGTTTSSMAQAGVIFFNNKYTTAQKAFMIPQELIECGLSAASLFFLTKPVQKATLKALSSGKILSDDLVKYLNKNNLINKRGKADFNIYKSINQIIENVKKSENYINASNADKKLLLKEHINALNHYNYIEDSSLAIATTGAAAFSTAIVIPVVRNKFASYYQKKNMEYHDEYQKYKNLYNINNRGSSLRI